MGKWIIVIVVAFGLGGGGCRMGGNGWTREQVGAGGTIISGSVRVDDKFGGGSHVVGEVKVEVIRRVVERAAVAAAIQGSIDLMQESVDRDRAEITDDLSRADYEPRIAEMEKEIKAARKVMAGLPGRMDAKDAFAVMEATEYDEPNFWPIALKGEVASVMTDGDGKYVIRVESPGDYYVYSRYQDYAFKVQWLTPIKAGGTGITVDMNSGDAVSVQVLEGD